MPVSICRTQSAPALLTSPGWAHFSSYPFLWTLDLFAGCGPEVGVEQAMLVAGAQCKDFKLPVLSIVNIRSLKESFLEKNADYDVLSYDGRAS